MSICTECKKRSTCQELCQEAEEYVNQDYVSLKEVPVSNSFLDTLPSHQMFRPKNKYTSSELKAFILILHKDGLKNTEIAYHLPVTLQYVGQVIKSIR